MVALPRPASTKHRRDAGRRIDVRRYGLARGPSPAAPVRGGRCADSGECQRSQIDHSGSSARSIANSRARRTTRSALTKMSHFALGCVGTRLSPTGEWMYRVERPPSICARKWRRARSRRPARADPRYCDSTRNERRRRDQSWTGAGRTNPSAARRPASPGSATHWPSSSELTEKGGRRVERTLRPSWHRSVPSAKRGR